jgi:hypothetical protein
MARARLRDLTYGNVSPQQVDTIQLVAPYE